MKFITSCKLALALLGLGALGSATVASAASYDIYLDTSAVAGNAAGPFYLDFQSIWGSGSDQTITLSDFSLTGGGFVAGTDVAIGAITGSVASSLVLSPGVGSFYNEFFQQFEASVTQIQFKLDITDAPSGATPTSFAVSLLDATNLFAIPTNGFADTLLFFNIDGTNTNYSTGISIGDTAGVRASVPETGATIAMLLGSVTVLGLVRRRFSAAA